LGTKEEGKITNGENDRKRKTKHKGGLVTKEKYKNERRDEK
jgi:hypothetical protein